MIQLHSRQCKDGTNIDIIQKKKANKNNKTGIRGVCYITAKNKYKAYIYLNKKYYFLGYFDNLEEAKQARKEAEEEYYKPILNKYKKLD